MKTLNKLLYILFAIPMLSCSRPSTDCGTDNAVYYWRTTLTFDDAERSFIADHNVTTIYLRYFDVCCREAIMPELYPNATLQFIDSVPSGLKVIPVVYVTPDAAGILYGREEEIAGKIAKRVKAMSLSMGIEFDEIQLDCDWTGNSRDCFYCLCRNLKENLDSGVTVSATIRLHQLTQSPPPVDRGVLMVYNTGSFTNINTTNSIFSLQDIAPYLAGDRLASYDLPLDVAYPSFGWSVAFTQSYNGGYKFKGLLHQTDLSEYPEIRQSGDGLYTVTGIVDTGECVLKPGDKIRVEIPSFSDLMAVKSLIESQLGNRKHNNIIYHLDSKQLSNFTEDEINSIYSGHCR